MLEASLKAWTIIGLLDFLILNQSCRWPETSWHPLVYGQEHS